jgi:hypothetical protein
MTKPQDAGQKPDSDPTQPGHSEDAPGQQKPKADQDLPEEPGVDNDLPEEPEAEAKG